MKEKIEKLETEVKELYILFSSKKTELQKLKDEYAKSISKFKIGDKVILDNSRKEIVIIKDITSYFNEPRYWYARIKKNGEPYNECKKLYFYGKMELVK